MNSIRLTQNTNIETLHLDCEHFGGHAEHWKILTSQAQHDVPLWLQQALESPVSPMGLCQREQQLPHDIWLLQGTKDSPIKINQIITVDEHQQPKSIKTSFPSFYSPYQIQAKITRILACPKNNQAVLQVELESGTILYGYDTLFAVNAHQYQANQHYQIEINAFAYGLEKVPERETMLIDDPVAIRHHRALNDILAAHQGKTPDNLQSLLAQWQPKNDDDLQPVTIDISKMVAYLYGEHLGQEDEAWIQGDIIGKSYYSFMGRNILFYDVAIMREDQHQPIILRLINQQQDQEFHIGDYVRGNIWMQFTIHNVTG